MAAAGPDLAAVVQEAAEGGRESVAQEAAEAGPDLAAVAQEAAEGGQESVEVQAGPAAEVRRALPPGNG